MPVLHEYKGKDEHYVLTSIKGNIVTFQLTAEGQKKLLSAGILPGKTFVRGLLLDLYRSGDAYTHGTGPGKGMIEVDSRQMELDFSHDPEPESMFPSCGNCSSVGDLHLVEEIKGKDHYGVILCGICRFKKSDKIDTSIPLPLVTRGILNRLLEMKNIEKIDSSVSSYRALLDKEFQSKWDALAKRKPGKQEKLKLDKGDEKQGKLIQGTYGRDVVD
jgi:hypothetical protein